MEVQNNVMVLVAPEGILWRALRDGLPDTFNRSPKVVLTRRIGP